MVTANTGEAEKLRQCPLVKFSEVPTKAPTCFCLCVSSTGPTEEEITQVVNHCSTGKEISCTCGSNEAQQTQKTKIILQHDTKSRGEKEGGHLHVQDAKHLHTGRRDDVGYVMVSHFSEMLQDIISDHITSLLQHVEVMEQKE